MLICPQCQFENPNTNKFCQRCGISLTHMVCPKCSTDVPLSEERCQNCGTVTGTMWWAIIQTSQSLRAGAYLDAEQRYQLLEPLPPTQERAATSEVQVKVLDCQPLQLSPLEVGGESIVTMTIPAIATAYLNLQSQSHRSLPTIHDAWQQEGTQVVLIEDRSDWPKLSDLWHDSQTELLQILHWLYEMTQLWAALEPWHCRQSLLELSNLRVDEDQTLGLQRLYTELEAAEKPLTLQDLGQMWQRLFQESQRTQFGSLIQLMDDLQAGNIQTITDLCSRLEETAKELQVIVNSTSDQSPAPMPQQPPTAQTILQDDPQDSLTRSGDMPTVALPVQLISLEDAGSTDVGRQRHHNEDYFGIETTINKQQNPTDTHVQVRGLYILCDGMGGHAAGEVASTMAVKTLQQYFQTHWQPQQLPVEDTIREAVRLANQAIYDVNQQDARSGIGRMGTTLVLVLIQDTRLAVAHVGDSRFYQLSRKQGLEQVTVDHEVGQREILRGVEPAIAYARPDAYQLTQALGPRDENFINPDVKFLELKEDTLLILASDGLCDNDLLEHHWQTHLELLLNPDTSLEGGVSNLIGLANQYNGHDNITAILIRAKVLPRLEQQD